MAGFRVVKNKQMGDLTEDLMNYGMVAVGNKISTSPEQREKAVEQLSSVGSSITKNIIVSNKELFIAGLIIFGLSMAVTNVAITSFVLGSKK